MVTGAQVLADQLKKVGIELEIKQYEYGVWLERFNTHQFELAWNVTAATPIPIRCSGGLPRRLAATRTTRPTPRSTRCWKRAS